MSPKTADRTEEIAEGVAENGHAVAVFPQAPSGPRLPQKIKTVKLPAEYGDAGFTVDLWINAPSKLVDDALMASAPNAPTYADLERRVQALEQREKAGEDVTAEYKALDDEGDERRRVWLEGIDEAKQRRLSALRRLVVRHNAWCDENGQSYSPAGTDAFWEEIPDELAAAIMILLRQQASKLPSSMMRAGRR
jgi:hypothetical protein